MKKIMLGFTFSKKKIEECRASASLTVEKIIK